MLFLSTCICHAQVPTPDEIWGGITEAANADILSYRTAQRETNRKAVTDSITSQLNELERVFDNPYSTQAIDNSLTTVEQLISNPNITASQASVAEQLYLKLISYEAAAKELHARLILNPDNNAFQNTGTLLGMDEMSPVFVTMIAEEIKTALNNNGLFKMPIDKDYKYLNEKRSLVANNLESIISSKSDDANQLIGQLRATLNAVNEISPDFPKADIILDQKFNSDK